MLRQTEDSYVDQLWSGERYCVGKVWNGHTPPLLQVPLCSPLSFLERLSIPIDLQMTLTPQPTPAPSSPHPPSTFSLPSLSSGSPTAAGATLLSALFPRAFIDPNRPPDDIDPSLVDDSRGPLLLPMRPGPKTK